MHISSGNPLSFAPDDSGWRVHFCSTDTHSSWAEDVVGFAVAVRRGAPEEPSGGAYGDGLADTHIVPVILDGHELVTTEQYLTDRVNVSLERLARG